MKHSSATRGGVLPYISPSLEVLDFSVEQGFANSPTGTWDESIKNDLTWGDSDDDLF